MKIAFFEVKNWEKDYLKEKLDDKEVIFFETPLTKDNIDTAKDFDIIASFIYSDLHKEVVSHLPHLKFIATMSTGFDHIDVSYAKEKGIKVSNVPTYGANTVAEHAFALMLCLAKNIYPSIERTRSGNFSLDGLTTFDLKGKTLGIVGMGKIGKEVADIARGFEMRVLAYDIHENKKLAKEVGFTYVSLEQLLKLSDIITIHLVHDESTHHIIHKNNISQIKKGAYLINTARGALIETEALIEALDKGILAGAGLDVLEEEQSIKEEKQLLSKEFISSVDLKTLIENHMLLNRENVIITPHNAFNSKEALSRILDVTIENIHAFIKGKPINLV